jgi:large subunit ribosomal protein L17
MQGRKNVHGKAGVRFKAPYTAQKFHSMIRNVVSELIVHGEVKVTEGVTASLVSEAESLVTYAKQGDVAARRQAARVVRHGIKDDKGVEALDKLFKEIGPKYKDRQGGYTQVFKLGGRRGDNAPIDLVKWVD